MLVSGYLISSPELPGEPFYAPWSKVIVVYCNCYFFPPYAFMPPLFLPALGAFGGDFFKDYAPVFDFLLSSLKSFSD